MRPAEELITPVFENGERVEAWDVYTHQYRPAVILKHEPYFVRGRLITDGYRIRWLDISYNHGDTLPCEGGWNPVRAIRRKA